MKYEQLIESAWKVGDLADEVVKRTSVSEWESIQESRDVMVHLRAVRSLVEDLRVGVSAHNGVVRHTASVPPHPADLLHSMMLHIDMPDAQDVAAEMAEPDVNIQSVDHVSDRIRGELMKINIVGQLISRHMRSLYGWAPKHAEETAAQ